MRIAVFAAVRDVGGWTVGRVNLDEICVYGLFCDHLGHAYFGTTSDRYVGERLQRKRLSPRPEGSR